MVQQQSGLLWGHTICLLLWYFKAHHRCIIELTCMDDLNCLRCRWALPGMEEHGGYVEIWLSRLQGSRSTPSRPHGRESNRRWFKTFEPSRWVIATPTDGDRESLIRGDSWELSSTTTSPAGARDSGNMNTHTLNHGRQKRKHLSLILLSQMQTWAHSQVLSAEIPLNFEY